MAFCNLLPFAWDVAVEDLLPDCPKRPMCRHSSVWPQSPDKIIKQTTTHTQIYIYIYIFLLGTLWPKYMLCGRPSPGIKAFRLVAAGMEQPSRDRMTTWRSAFCDFTALVCPTYACRLAAVSRAVPGTGSELLQFGHLMLLKQRAPQNKARQDLK